MMHGMPRQVDGDARHSAADQTLRGAGLRRTPQRQMVLDVLGNVADSGRPHHLTADEVLQQATQSYANINRSTVYRVLDSLVAGGLVVQHMLAAVAHYELASDVHHHLVCHGCGAVFDLPRDGLQRVASTARSAYGFLVGPVGVTIEGECADCAASSRHTTHSAGPAHR